MLRHQLLLQQPPVLAELHVRAARWYAGREAILEALAHAAAARDWPFVGRLVAARAAPLIVSTKRAPWLGCWSGSLPTNSPPPPSWSFAMPC
jgi:LuxR family transcriptional regulator, maltose regulon positive regulatory protein